MVEIEGGGEMGPYTGWHHDLPIVDRRPRAATGLVVETATEPSDLTVDHFDRAGRHGRRGRRRSSHRGAIRRVQRNCRSRRDLRCLCWGWIVAPSPSGLNQPIIVAPVTRRVPESVDSADDGNITPAFQSSFSPVLCCRVSSEVWLPHHAPSATRGVR